MQNSHNLSVRHLRAFLQIAATGSFTRAAESLHQTQSTLTATIKQLEQQVGLSLFDRTTRSVILTQAGERFLPQAKQLISDFDTAIGDLQAISAHQHGLVTVAASPSTVSRLLPKLVQLYKAEYPDVDICLRDDNAAQLEQLIISNDADFAIAASHSQHPDLNYQQILTDDYGVVLTRHHPLSDIPQLTWQQIEAEPLVHLSSDSAIRQQLTEHIPAFSQPPGLEVSTTSGLAALVEQGLGITLLPALAASTTAFQNLNFVPLSNPLITRRICIITRKSRSLSPAAASFLKLIQQYLEQARLPTHVRLTSQ
ncbi:LysR family transcriptional regulator [Aliamphritea ceti]|uniref:LysR family transcriptional regulator n=1 Tax=Aliamphritea ceti TaxID=1524258 RepID=UPI0021C31195|nr:LysR family transcriptional regulator [Aliamphritea ceti]